jgi:hypothetical protein
MRPAGKRLPRGKDHFCFYYTKLRKRPPSSTDTVQVNSINHIKTVLKSFRNPQVTAPLSKPFSGVFFHQQKLNAKSLFEF